MTIPMFISSTPHIPPNWAEAFPDFHHKVGLPDTFDLLDDSIIFLNYMDLSSTDRKQWLQVCVMSQRKVFVLSPTPNDTEAIEVIKSGAVGYGHTLASKTCLQEMALVVRHGGVWLGSTLIQRVITALTDVKPKTEPREANLDSFSSKFTEREFEIARYVATGATNADISVALKITERTVKAHITSLFHKLGVKNRVELALRLNNVSHSSNFMVN